MDKPLIAFRGAIRLNNKTPVERLILDQDSKFVELAVATNVVIKDDNSLQLCSGFTYLNTTPAQDGYKFEDRCFYVAGTTLYYLTPSLVPTAIRNNLTPDLQMTYAPRGDRVFYTNGAESGFIFNDLSYSWGFSPTVPAPLDKSQEPAPLGHLVGSYKGYTLVAVDNIIHRSEEFNPFAFVLGEGYLGFPGRILLMAECGQLLVVGDEAGLYVVSDPFGQYVIKKVADAPPITWRFEETFDFGKYGNGVVVLLSTGLCFISEDGQLVALTKNHYTMPSLTSASLCSDDTFLYAPTL